MRKFSIYLSLAFLCLAVAVILTWSNRENILAHFMSKQLRVPVSIRSLSITKTSAEMDRLWIGNFPQSHTTTSFTAETLKVNAKPEQIFGKPVTIERIDIDHIFVGIEFYHPNGTDSNWIRILEKSAPKELLNDKAHHLTAPKKKKSKDYLIHTLTLRNLTVEVTQVDGSVKRYPTINQMEFYNINSETGFPVEEIEKAVFDLLIKDLFKKLQIDQLFS